MTISDALIFILIGFILGIFRNQIWKLIKIWLNRKPKKKVKKDDAESEKYITWKEYLEDIEKRRPEK